MSATVKGQDPQHRGLRSYLPVLQWLPSYKRSWLRADLIAGLTLAALVVPEGMAYAELAGMPPETALYGAWIALVMFAIFGGSRQLVVGAASSVAIMSASIVVNMAAPGSADFIALTMALASLTGIISILAGILKLGIISQFFSESVLVGFISGLALLVIIKQVPKLLAVESAKGDFWERLYELVTDIPDTHLLTLAMGLSSLALMLLLERRFHRIPAALAALVYGIVVVSVFNLDTRGLHIVGDIPSGLAPPKLPGIGLDDMMALLPGAIGLTLVIFAEAIGPIQSFAGKHRYEVIPNQELIGLGLANVGAGLFQSFSVGGSLSKSASNDSAGAKTQLTGLVAAAITILVAIFLTPLFHNLPEATLGAIVIVAVARMFKLKAIRNLYRIRKSDFFLAFAALLAVLTFEKVLHALLFAVVLSLLVLVYRTSQPKYSILGRIPGRLQFADTRQKSQLRLHSGTVDHPSG